MNGIGFRTVASWLLASSAAFALLGSSAAMAADNAGTTADAGSIETVMVTAQRREQKNVDVPIAITTVNSEQLAQAGITDLQGIAKVAPAVRFDANGAYVQPSIRGVGSAVISSTSGSNVGIYTDGFYSPSPLGANFELLNVTGVQVLKGPQGTLFGHNTTGGAILVTTSDPSYDRHGMVGASYGNYNTQRYEGYFTTGLTDNIAFDVAGFFSSGDGFVKDIVTGSKKDGQYQNWLIRTGLKADVTDSISLLFRYEHSVTDDPTNELLNAFVVNGSPWVPAAQLGAFFPAAYATKPHEVANLGALAYHATTDTFQLTGKADLDFATLTSYTQYSMTTGGADNFDISMGQVNLGLGQGFVPVFQVGKFYNTHDKYFTQELLLNSDSEGRLKWTAGAFYLDWTEPFYATPIIVGLINLGAETVSQESVSTAIYADATYQVLDDLYLSAGLRYSHDEIKHANTAGVLVLPNSSNDTLTPRAVLRYALNDNSSVYASWSRGSKSGFYNVIGVTTLAQATVKPEKIDAYEVGYKYVGHGLSLDLASYYYDYTNLQISGFTAGGGGTGSFTQDAPASRI